MINRIEKVLAYLLLAAGVTTGLWYLQHNSDKKFCAITIQNRENRRDSLIERKQQAQLFADYSYSNEIRAYNFSLVKKYEERLKHDPDLQEPFDCEVNEK